MRRSRKNREEQQRKFVKMTTRPVKRLVSEMFLPTVFTMLITSLYNLADTFFVGRIGSAATAAVGANFCTMAIIQAVGFGFGHGAGNTVSRILGRQDIKEASIVAMLGAGTSFITGLALMGASLLVLPLLVNAIGVTPTIYPYAENYLRFILLGAPFFAASLTLNNLLRLQGNATMAMVGIVFGAVLNAVLDPILMFGCGLGFTGCGLSTLISQICSLIFLIIGGERCDAVKLRLRYFRPSRARYVAIMQGGLPSVGRQSMRCMASILFNHATKLFGDNFYAAMIIVIRLANFIFAIAIGIGQGFQSVCGFNYGARLYRRVLHAYRFTQMLSVLVLIAVSATLFVYAEQVTSLFTSQDEVVRLASMAMRLQCISIPFMGFANIASMFMQNINKYKPAFFIAIGRDGLFFIPAILICTPLWGFTGVMVAQPVADILTFALALPLMFIIKHQVKEAMHMHEEEHLR